MGSKSANRTPDTVIAKVAARQHGVVSLAQLEDAGIHRRGLTRRVRSQRLHRIHRGVYAVGHAGMSDEGRWMAAVLAYGAGAVLSHRSAAALWGMLAVPAVVDVTVPGSAGRTNRDGIRLHRSLTLLPSQTTRRAAIPVTKPARTLADLRRVVPRGQFAAALRQAEFLRLPLEAQLELDHTRSELEAKFLAVCSRHRLPVPEVNVRVGPFLVDFLWRDQGLIVETDGYRYHRGRAAFEDDRSRDLDLKLRGYEVVRFTHRQVVDEAARVAETLRALLR